MVSEVVLIQSSRVCGTVSRYAVSTKIVSGFHGENIMEVDQASTPIYKC